MFTGLCKLQVLCLFKKNVHLLEPTSQMAKLKHKLIVLTGLILFWLKFQTVSKETRIYGVRGHWNKGGSLGEGGSNLWIKLILQKSTWNFRGISGGESVLVYWILLCYYWQRWGGGHRDINKSAQRKHGRQEGQTFWWTWATRLVFNSGNEFAQHTWLLTQNELALLSRSLYFRFSDLDITFILWYGNLN